MDKIEKALKSLRDREKKKLKNILVQINKKNFENLDLKKLKGKNEIYRVRKGNLRIIFHKLSNGTIKILAIERRASKTYKKR